MPVLIGAFLRKPRDLLVAALFVALIAKLTAMSPKAIAKLALVGAQRRPRLVMMDGELFKRLARALFGYPSGLADGALKFFAKFACECLHG
jgi:hypothetical protein